MKLNLGFLASGRGSNVEAILNNIEKGKLSASPKVVISNNPDADVLQLAWDRGIPQYCINKNNVDSSPYHGRISINSIFSNSASANNSSTNNSSANNSSVNNSSANNSSANNSSANNSSKIIAFQNDSVDKKIVEVLRNHNVNLVILAGYMKRIGKPLLDTFPNRIINIHPSLLPRFGGKGMYGVNVHEAVINSADKVSGATVHLVNEHYDQGRILMQFQVPRLPRDNAVILGDRVLSAEHALYSQTLHEIQQGLINLDDYKVIKL